MPCYEIQRRGCTSSASNVNIACLQMFQTKHYETVIGPRYVYNADLQRDLGIPTVKEEVCKRFAGKYKARLSINAYLQ